MMTYDFHGTWERVTGHNSPLYRGSQDFGDLIYFNTVSRDTYCDLTLGMISNKGMICLRYFGVPNLTQLS